MFAVDRVAFGMPNVAPPSPRPLYHVARVFVRVLERPDALAHVSKLLPKTKPVPDQNRCRLRILGNALAVVDRLRQFMAAVHQDLSQPWSEQAEPGIGAVPAGGGRGACAREGGGGRAGGDAAHRRLRRAPSASSTRSPGSSASSHATRPQEFAALAAEFDAARSCPTTAARRCEPSDEDREPPSRPIVELLTEASDQVRRVAGGN